MVKESAIEQVVIDTIVVPCHRVVGANGALVGFAPGVALKKVLLDHEQRFRKA